MLILYVYRIVQWTERIGKCTVRGAPTPKGPFKQIQVASPAIARRCHRKLHHVMSGTGSSRAVKRYGQRTKDRRCKNRHHNFFKPESSLEANGIDRDSRHVWELLPKRKNLQGEGSYGSKCRLYPAVIPNGVRDLSIASRSHRNLCDQSTGVRSLGPSRTGIVCAARDDIAYRANWSRSEYARDLRYSRGCSPRIGLIQLRSDRRLKRGS